MLQSLLEVGMTAQPCSGRQGSTSDFKNHLEKKPRALLSIVSVERRRVTIKMTREISECKNPKQKLPFGAYA